MSVEIDLFVCGAATERSQDAMRNLAFVCRSRYGDDFTVNVVDVLDEPDAAERANVIVTPMIVVRQPLPVQRFVGDLRDLDAEWATV